MVIIMEMTMIITTTFTTTISLAFIRHGDHHRHGDDLDLDHRHVIDQVEELGLHLPPRCLGSIWSLAYATDQDGHITSSLRS